MIMRMVVDLPEPFGPGTGDLPGTDLKGQSSTATVSPYRFVSPVASIT